MNYYEVLGITSNVDIYEIKSAYRKLAMLYHPDRETGNAETFKLINEAYSILSDNEKRKQYDVSFLSSSKNNNVNLDSLTHPYDSTLNIFNGDLKEIFEIIKEGTTRNLKQTLGLMKNVNLENHYYQKYTPLMEAVYIQRIDMVEFMLKEIKNKYTRNNIVQIKYKKYINQINVEGKTALIIACLSNDSSEIMQLLIKEGAEVMIKDKESKTIFDYALFSQSDDVEEFVLNIKK